MTSSINPSPTPDVIVVGAGAAGENAAGTAAAHGLETMIVEHALVGGECSYWACIPSKILLQPAAVVEAARRTPGLSEPKLDAEAVLARRTEIVGDWDDTGQVQWLEGAKVALLRGHGHLVADRVVEVTRADGTRTAHEAQRAVVIATGSSNRIPAIEGLTEASTWDSRAATSADRVPDRLLVIGGGVVGVEMAQAWHSLGSDVTILQAPGRLLMNEEPEATADLTEALRDSGIVVHVDADTTRVDRPAPGGPVTVQVEIAGETTTIEADELLVAVGRQPNTASIGLEAVGLEPGEAITVDDHMRATGVNGGWLYAVGDVNGQALLTHAGKYQGRVAGAHIGGVDTAVRGNGRSLPRVVFTIPQVAAVGLTEQAARQGGMDVVAVVQDLANVAAASTIGVGVKGTCKLVVEAESRVVVGATFVGPTAGEMLHAATIAVVANLTLDDLWHAVPAFPTLSEVWLRLLEAFADEQQYSFC